MKIKIFNNTLNPILWKHGRLDQTVRLELLKIARDFYIKSEFEAPILDILLLGGSANYNWTKFSDLDLHIVVDVEKIRGGEHTEELTNLYKFKWNENHDLKIKGLPVEISIQDVTKEPRKSQGVFSLVKNKWIVVPNKETPDIDKEYIKEKYKSFTQKINNLINDDALQTSQKEELASKLMDTIKTMRNAGLEKHGEYSNENIVFKLLRSTKYIEKLANAKIEYYDKQFNEQLQEISWDVPADWVEENLDEDSWKYWLDKKNIVNLGDI